MKLSLCATALFGSLCSVAWARPWLVVNEDVNTTITMIADQNLGREALRAHFLNDVYSPHLTHYFINPQAMACGYETKVGEPMWETHPGNAPAPAWVRKFVILRDKGIDPYAVWTEVAREKGISPWVSMRMNDVHCVDKPMNGFATKMWLDHPEWRRGKPPHGNWNTGAFNYAVREVRDYHLALAREMMERYNPDGFECDWLRFPHHLTPGHERQEAQILTDFMREIRKTADAIGAKRGRKMLVGVRVASSVDGALGLGTDAAAWMREGLIDVLTVGNFWNTIDYDATWGEWKRLVKATDPKVKLLAAVDDGIARTCYKRDFPTPDEVAGYYDIAYAKGIEDGISVFNWFVNWPRHPVSRFIRATGATAEAVSREKRTTAVTYRDAVGDGMPSGNIFPVKLDSRREIAITAGRPMPGDRAFVRIFRGKDDARADYPFAEATLNGFKPITVEGDVCEFPLKAVKSGRNIFAIGPAGSRLVSGLELSLVPTVRLSPTGDDAKGNGSAAAPYRTPAHALLAAREAGGAILEFVGGTYELDAPLKLTAADSGIRFVAAAGANPILSAGRRIGGWTVDAKGWWHAKVAAGTKASQFYVNGKRRQRPHLPRKGYFFIAGERQPGPDGLLRFAVSPKDVNLAPEELAGVEACVFHVWSMSRIPVRSYDPTTHILTLSRKFRKEYGTATMASENWYRLDNVRAALGEPGDWYLAPDGEITYVPMQEDGRPDEVECVLSRYGSVVCGTGVQDVLFRGLTFAHADWTVPAEGQYHAQGAADLPAAVQFDYSSGIRLESCAVLHTGAYGVSFTRGCRNCVVADSRLVDLGAGGVKVGCFWDGEREAKNHGDGCVVENCLVRGGGRVDPGGVGVLVGHAANCRIERNTIHDLHYTGVSVGWDWCFAESAHDNLIAANHIYDIGQGVLSDMGGIYVLGRQRGTVERFNHVHDVTRARNCAFGIYFDSGTSFVTVSNNFVHACQDSNWFLAAISASNRVENNVFADSPGFQLRVAARDASALPTRFARNVLRARPGKFLPEFPSPVAAVDFADNLFLTNNVPRTAVRPKGFAKFSVKKAGCSPRVIEQASRIDAPRTFPAAPARPFTDCSCDFEQSAAGELWPGWEIHPKGKAEKTVRIVRTTAAQGRGSLEITDRLADYTPHLCAWPQISSGRVTLSFWWKIGPGARSAFEVRDREAWTKAAGPYVVANGTGLLRGRDPKRSVAIPKDGWFRVEVAFDVGAERTNGTYDVRVTLPSGEMRELAAQPLDRDFKTVGWLGFVSIGSTGSHYWIDDFRISSTTNNQQPTTDVPIGPKRTVEVTPQGISPREALETVREARRKGDRGPWTVRIAAGAYRLTEPLVLGPDDSDLAFVGEKGSVISGGGELGPWRSEGGGIWSVPIPKDGTGRPIWFEELFVNGRRAERSRLPNRGGYKIVTMTNYQDSAKDGGEQWVERCWLTNAEVRAALAAATPAQLAAAALCVDAKWCYAKRILRAWGSAAGTVDTFSAAPVPTFARWENTTNIFFENLPGGFDEPGEWFYDAVGGRVRYRPLPGEDMTSVRAVAPLAKLSCLVLLRGDPPRGRWVKNVSFSRIAFAHSDVTKSLSVVPEGPVQIVQYQAAFCHDGTVELEGAEGICFDECVFRQTGNHGIKFKGGCRNSLVSRCLFDDLGAGGVWIGAEAPHVAGDEIPLRRREVRQLAPQSTAFITVEDCEIRNGGQFNPEGTGVVITHASDCRVEHCDIHDFFYSGVSVGLTWGYRGSVSQRNTVAFNRIHDLGKGRMSDMGGVYTLGTSYGTCVSNNVIWNVRSYDYGGWGLYTDEGSEGIVLENNLVYDTHDGGFHQHYGADNLIRNNIFAFNRLRGAVRSARRLGMDEVLNSFHFYGNIVYTDGAPLVGDGVRCTWGAFSANLWFDAAKDARPVFDGTDWIGWKSGRKEIGGMYADPLFLNAKARDFRLKPESPAFKLGFKAWDFAAAGIRRE